ncbi:HD domain-containing protein [Candidatus Gribaldobacteria bacterium]|nr:HD domain-containing protein [Candidatus Gribaldobacteria bacterium]
MQITLEKAKELVGKHLKDKNNQIHSFESEAVLGALARELAENEDDWRIAGLLHDLDWEQIGDNYQEHGLKIFDILEQEGYEISEEIKQAIKSHNEKYTNVKRQNKLDYALSAGESITGLIYAYALMRPEKLEGMKASSLNKKFKDEKFAANVQRDLIADIEKIGLEKTRFFEIGIRTMQGLAQEIGF